MKVFKAAFTLALTTLIFLSAGAVFPAGLSASAEPSTRYAYVDKGAKAYFCSEKNEDSALFSIPETYCVQIISEDGNWYYVKYAEDNGVYRAIYGYCLKSELVSTPVPLENEYLHTTIKITYKADSGSNLFPPLEIEMTAAYYGEYTLGKTSLSYVYCGDKFGYVPERVENYPLNDLPKPTISGDVEKPKNDNALLITAIVITVAAATAIAILYFTSARKKPDQT